MMKVVKAMWLALAIAGSAGLVRWMSEHGDLGSKMGGVPERFTLQE